MIERPILITGCPRSGTSLIAGIVHRCGAWGGDMFGPTKNNQKGFFENKFVRETLVKGYLKELGVDPLGQHPLPDLDNLIPKPSWAADFERGLREQGYEDGPLFCKTVKGCLFWPVWRDAFPEARWVIVRRDDTEIAESCLRTAFMRAYDTVDGWLEWVEHHKKCFDQIWQNCHHVREVWSAQVVRGELDEIKSVVEWCGLEWDEAATREFIDPSLWRGSS